MLEEENIRVVVRCRPVNQREKNEGQKEIVILNKEKQQITVLNSLDKDEPPKNFIFDEIFDLNTTQTQFYNNVGYPIVEKVLEGYNGTIFSYGVTGSGKSYTMAGSNKGDEFKGVVPLAIEHIFNSVNRMKDQAQFNVRVSFLEIYNEQINDLFHRNYKNLTVREKKEEGIYIENLSTLEVHTPQELHQKYIEGMQNSTVACTHMGRISARSHFLFSITIERKDILNEQNTFKVGKLNLLVLAGSERQSKTQYQLQELKILSKSLNCLGVVINSLTQNQSHVPYRDSKLTRILQESFGGNTKTVMIANIGPSESSIDETISTLRFAQRAKLVKNKVRINIKQNNNLIIPQSEQIIQQHQMTFIEKDGIIKDDKQKKGINQEKSVSKCDQNESQKIQEEIYQEQELLIRKIESEKRLQILQDNYLKELKENLEIQENIIKIQQKRGEREKQQQFQANAFQKMNQEEPQYKKVNEKEIYETFSQMNEFQQSLEKLQEGYRSIEKDFKLISTILLQTNNRINPQDKQSFLKVMMNEQKNDENEVTNSNQQIDPTDSDVYFVYYDKSENIKLEELPPPQNS